MDVSYARWLVYLIVGVPALTWLFTTRNNTLRLLAVAGILILVQEVFTSRRQFLGISVGPSVAFAYVALIGLYFQRGRFPSLGVQGVLWAGFLFSALIGLILGSFGTGSLFRNILLFQEHYFEGAIFFLVGMMALDRDEEVNRFLYGFVVLICGGVAVLHLVFLITGWHPAAAEQIVTRSAGDYTQFGGVIFLNPNTQADFYAMTLPMALLFFLGRRSSVPRRFLLGAILMAMTVSLLLQAARGGLLATIVMAGIALLLSGEPLGRTVVAAVAGVFAIGGAILAGIYILPETFEAMFAHLSQEGLETERFWAWSGFLRMLADHPFGIGLIPENILATGGRYGTGTLANAHSIYLNIAVKTGILGLIAFLALVGSVVMRNWRVLRAAQDPETRQAALYLLLALGGFLLAGTLEPIYTNGYKLNQLFWLLAGLSLATSQRALATARQARIAIEFGESPTQQQALSEHRPDHV